VRVRYAALDPDLFARLEAFDDLRKVFDDLVLRTGGDVDQALEVMRRFQKLGYLPRELDLERFFDQLVADGAVRIDMGHRKLSARALRGLRSNAFDLLFRNLRSGPLGEHRTPRTGAGGERLGETRPYRFGDALSSIDGVGTLRNALRRTGTGPFNLQPDDLQVHATQHSTSSATILLLDVSHSMVLYGEDRITPAKQVAMALAELIERKYPKDSLDVALFGDEARPVDVTDLPFVMAGPYHTNTRDALRLARRLLRRRRHPNKRIVLITDGKPSALTIGGQIYKNPNGLDPRIVKATLEEAVMCRRERIPITTFMIAEDPYLQEFVEELTRLNKGQAYFCPPDDLGSAVFVDFLRNRRRRV